MRYHAPFRRWFLLVAALGPALLLPRPAAGPAAAQGTPPAGLTPLPPLDPARAINVRSWGAKGDGVTADQQAIQEALNRAQPGDTIYFPAGTYLLKEPITVQKEHLTLWGEGARSVLSCPLLQSSLRLGADGSPMAGLVVTRLTFLGLPGKYMADGVGGGGILLFGPRGAVIQDCDFVGCASPISNDGPVGSTYGTRVENCRINGWGGVAIFCNGGEQILHCSLVQDDPDLYGQRSSHGLYIHSGCTHVLVQDTLIRNARKYAAQIYGRDVGAITDDVVFRNDTIIDCANGITIQSSEPNAAQAHHVLIEGCEFLDTYDGPALSIKQGDGIIVRDNVLDGQQVGLQLGVWAPYEPGFSLANLQAYRNTIRHYNVGIYLLASNGGRFTNVTIRGNKISDCRIPIKGRYSAGVTYTP